MKPFPYADDTPRSLDAFRIDWSSIVVESKRLPESELPYVAAIAKYSHCGVPDGATFVQAMQLAADPELDRFLGLAHQLYLGEPFAAQLLVHARLEMEGVTAARVLEAKFEWITPFAVEGVLADDLYGYGMYDFFYNHHTPNEARDLARDLARRTTGDDLANIVPFTTRGAWSDWFDPHSCTDRSWLWIERTSRRAWLFAFSHSD